MMGETRNSSPNRWKEHLSGKGDANRRILQDAAIGDLFGVQRALVCGADVDARDHVGRTPLILAAQYSSHRLCFSLLGNGDQVCRVVHRLLEAGADANAVDHSGRTPLMHAASTQDPEIVRMLLAHGANPAIRRNEWYGRNALLMAVEHGNLPVTTLLLEHLADPDAVGNDGQGALHLAANLNPLSAAMDMVRLLLAYGANPATCLTGAGCIKDIPEPRRQRLLEVLRTTEPFMRARRLWSAFSDDMAITVDPFADTSTVKVTANAKRLISTEIRITPEAALRLMDDLSRAMRPIIRWKSHPLHQWALRKTGRRGSRA